MHIADVSFYVTPDSVLDKEAYSRATSVYLVDRTIPMLPEHLSNGLCSLRPDEEKLCFSAVFELNDKAEVVKQWFGRTIIKSNRRFTYEEAQAMIEGGEGDYKEEILTLNDLAQKLRPPVSRTVPSLLTGSRFVSILTRTGNPRACISNARKRPTN